MLQDEWVFYLKLDPKLDETFIKLDGEFKKYSLSLIPIDFKGLCEISKGVSRINVIVFVKNLNNLDYYTKRINKLMKMMIIHDRVQLFHISSFKECNHFDLGYKDNYTFFDLPQLNSRLCESIISQIMDTPEIQKQWPGGRRPRMEIER